MKIIITMAGESSRFKVAGFSCPKYMLHVQKRSIFAWSMESLRNFFEYEFIFITQSKHSADSFISQECNKLGIKSFSIHSLDQSTAGQAATVLTACNSIKSNEPILIYNIDTYVRSQCLDPKHIKGSGWIPCFNAKGQHWSFISFNNQDRVLAIAEKNRISEFATIGLYYFATFELFKYAKDNFDFSSLKEQFVAPLYSSLISQNLEIFTTEIPSDDVFPLGTPEEVETFENLQI